LEANVTNCPNCRAPIDVPAEKNVARLLELLKRTPGRHTPWAQFTLGVKYANGRGVPQDYVEAVKWTRMAADQGHAPAQCNLGVMYENGRGVRQDDVEAVKLYRLAADQGNASAQFNLGVVYERGRGVRQDYVEAVKWFGLAADQGDADAQCYLGTMHDTGQGVPQNFPKAAKWFKLAADQGHATAIQYLGMALHQDLFPPGTKVKLVGLKAAALNGKRGVVVARNGAAAPALGRIAVELVGGGGTKAIPYEKLERI
jgi:TPR repeat protein